MFLPGIYRLLQSAFPFPHLLEAARNCQLLCSQTNILSIAQLVFLPIKCSVVSMDDRHTFSDTLILRFQCYANFLSKNETPAFFGVL